LHLFLKKCVEPGNYRRFKEQTDFYFFHKKNG